LILSRLVNVLFALVLLVALVIALDPQSRRKATEAFQAWEPTLKQLDNRIVVNAPPLLSTPDRTPTPLPTATAVVENDDQIPVTGEQDSSKQPIIQVNWDALGDALRQFWVSLSKIKIDVTPKDTK
jgi:hypothetical protein